MYQLEFIVVRIALQWSRNHLWIGGAKVYWEGWRKQC